MSQSEGPAWWFAFLGSELLVHVEDAGVGIPTAADLEAVGVPPLTGLEIGRLGDRLCYAAELPAGTVPPAGMALLGLRAVYGKVDPETYRLAGRAVQIVEWDRTHRFCGHCGTPTAMKSDEIARVCPNCGALFFPRISPAIIVLIQDGDRALLARSHRFPPGRYSTVAGFVEPGETLEETVVREVSEEVGVQIRNIRYFGSQPWPFPHSLMIGFTAEYAGGEIRIQEAEIADARWFRVDELPDLPPRMSIARQLIDWFVHSCTEK